MGKFWAISLLGIVTTCGLLVPLANAQSGSASATLSLLVPVSNLALAQQPEFSALTVSKAMIDADENQTVSSGIPGKIETTPAYTYQLWVHL